MRPSRFAWSLAIAAALGLVTFAASGVVAVMMNHGQALTSLSQYPLIFWVGAGVFMLAGCGLVVETTKRL